MTRPLSDQGEDPERTRAICSDGGWPMPDDDEWQTVEEGGRPDLCWGDTLLCSTRAEKTIESAAVYRKALEDIHLATRSPVTQYHAVCKGVERIAAEALAFGNKEASDAQ